jgi:hypothetical protein
MKRQRVKCIACAYTWKTRSKDLSGVSCPRCGNQALPPNEIPEPEPIQTPTPATCPYGQKSYGKLEAQRYVRYLGCWTFVNPTDAAKRRDPEEYKALLRQLIEVNKTRHDQIGMFETQYAKQALGEWQYPDEEHGVFVVKG